jgi:hypothetical protein
MSPAASADVVVSDQRAESHSTLADADGSPDFGSEMGDAMMHSALGSVFAYVRARRVLENHPA